VGMGAISRCMSTKDQLLACLKEGKGNWISGELLGERLYISRTAIWKHIGALKEDGYVIESSRKRGYLLREIPDALLQNEIRENLKTRILGKSNIYHFNSTDSTNVMAEHFASEGAAEGDIVVAEYQTQGKGRKGRSWFSPAGEGIYVSIILRPRISPHEAPKLTLMASVAIAEAIAACVPVDAAIKWPNDILIAGKKVAGILTEIKAEIDKIHHVVVGVGINVNTSYESFPLDIRDNATSLFRETGNKISRTFILKTCLECLEKQYEILQNQGFTPILEQWKQLSEMAGKKITVDVLDTSYAGIVEDVNEDGYLIIRDQEGNTRRIVSGDVFLHNDGMNFK